ncbi:dehydrogenase/reductase SDR family member 13 [Plectosphaerella plurivora]|uniref:Dehydrogenase/reductase SDR family member 13 n=1 Tax=Plectosphaerella plurivora TaxID=936078 RepID=A0A9P8VAT1_9PEZI|nr:dehydrogenase/reductase SDR family member 13 [Plectosphaerella plurivora]
MVRLFDEVSSQFKDLPVPDALQTGRTVIITGANVGLGLEAARHFTRLQSDRVIVACRDKVKGDAAVSSIRASHPDSPTKLDVWLVDLGDFASVKAFAEKAEKLDRVDILVSNAGLATATYIERSDGWESTLAVNVIGTFLLIFLMMPKMRETATKYKTTPHMTVTSSGAGHLASFPERKEEKIFPALKANRGLLDRYNVSKLLQVIITKQLAAATRHSGHPANENIIFNTVHPGLCQTELYRSMPFPLNYPMNFVMRMFGRTSEMGSRCLLAGALAGDESNGRYMENCAVADYAPILNGEEGEAMQVRVWEELVAILEETQPGITGLI